MTMESVQRQVLPSSANSVAMSATTLSLVAALMVVVLVPSAAGFSTHTIPILQRGVATTSLFAGPPQYQKHEGILQRSECVGKGSYLLTIDYPEITEESCPQYKPGHVLALEIQPPSSETEITEESEKSAVSPSSPVSSMTTMTEKTQKDLEGNGGWLRGPYTVSFGYGGNTNNIKHDGFRILIKEVGYKSHVFATAAQGTPVVFGGKFKVPIAEGIRAASEAVVGGEDSDNDIEDRGETKKVVMVSSGVGVGPCVGAIEELLLSSLSSGEETIATIDLIASFRTQEESSMGPALETLKEEFRNKDGSSKLPEIHWKPVITSEVGRLSSKGPESLRDDYLRSSSAGSAVTNTHYHIIGNGQLVNEWKKGLAKAGVPSERVTVEAYFNHTEKPDPSAIDTICEAVLGLDNTHTGRETETATMENAQDAAAAAVSS